jgi:hypothetical protein
MKMKAPAFSLKAALITVATSIGGYKMDGILGGLRAYGNDDKDMFTALMNHGMLAYSTGPVGLKRTHGGNGTYLCQWVISKKAMEVLSDAELMMTVMLAAAISRKKEKQG